MDAGIKTEQENNEQGTSNIEWRGNATSGHSRANCEPYTGQPRATRKPLSITWQISPELHRSLPVVPLIADQRYYGEAPVRLPPCQRELARRLAVSRRKLSVA